MPDVKRLRVVLALTITAVWLLSYIASALNGSDNYTGPAAALPAMLLAAAYLLGTGMRNGKNGGGDDF
jgi:hypothetical protein